MNCITTANLDRCIKSYLRKATIVFQQNEIVTCKSKTKILASVQIYTFYYICKLKFIISHYMEFSMILNCWASTNHLLSFVNYVERALNKK